MGIITNDTPDPIVEDHICFLAGKTPKYLDICFQGIQKGNQWQPSDGEPRNGIFLLQYFDFQTYLSVAPYYDIEVILTADFTAVYIDEDSPAEQFYYFQYLPCHWAAESERQDPIRPFWGGTYQISFKPAQTGPSMAQAMSDMGIERAAATKYEFGRVNDNVLWQRFSRKTDGTRLYVRRENY
jgi:hypothetical protein